MDAVKYLKEAVRMCDAMTGSCDDCPFCDWRVAFPCKSSNGWLDLANPEKCVEIVEKWSAEHPKKTRQTEFLKMFPNAMYNDSSTLMIRPCELDQTELQNGRRCNYYNGECRSCRKEYWSQEVGDDE